jgi:Zn-finger nucleic acid-binding protein
MGIKAVKMPTARMEYERKKKIEEENHKKHKRKFFLEELFD